MEIIKSVPKSIQLSKDLSHQIPWSTECFTPPWISLGVVEGQQCGSMGFNVCRVRWQMPLLLSHWQSLSDQIRSVAQSCPTLCDPMNCNTPGLPVHHQLPEFTQTHVHRVSEAIQPSHPLSSPSPPAPNPSQHQSLFQWVNSSHEVAKVLEFQL